MNPISLPGLVSPHDVTQDRQFAMSLARGLEVLRAFTPADPVLGNGELHRRTGLSKATISRLAYTLTLLGYLNYDERLQKYRLGSGVLSLGYPMLASMRIRQVARPHMEALSRASKCTVNLGIRDRTSVVYIEACHVDSGNMYQPDIGSTRPILTSSIGRALLLALPVHEREAVLNRLRLDDPASFEQDIQHYIRDNAFFQANRFCHSTGDWKTDVHAVGAPLRVPDDEPRVAINCTMSVHRRGAKQIIRQEVAPMLLDTVRSIEAAYGMA